MASFDYSSDYFKVVDRNMNGLEYHEGIVKDPIPFDPSGSCKAGGIYFTTAEQVFGYLGQYGHRIAKIRIPPGTPVYKDPFGEKWKAPVVEVVRIYSAPVKQLPFALPTFQAAQYQRCIQARWLLNIATRPTISKATLAMVMYHIPSFIPYLRWPGTAAFLARAIRCTAMFRYVAQQHFTEDILHCMAATCAFAWLEFVPHSFHSAALYFKAIECNELNIEHIPIDQLTEQMCVAHCKKYGRLDLVPEAHRTRRVCQAAVMSAGTNLQFVPPQLITPAMCAIASHDRRITLNVIPRQFRTRAICLRMLKATAVNVASVPEEFLTGEVRNALAEFTGGQTPAHAHGWLALVTNVPPADHNRREKKFQAAVQLIIAQSG